MTNVGEGLAPPGDFGTKSHRQRRSVRLFFLGKSENDEVFFGGRVKTLLYASHPINNNYVNNQH